MHFIVACCIVSITFKTILRENNCFNHSMETFVEVMRTLSRYILKDHVCIFQLLWTQHLFKLWMLFILRFYFQSQAWNWRSLNFGTVSTRISRLREGLCNHCSITEHTSTFQPLAYRVSVSGSIGTVEHVSTRELSSAFRPCVHEKDHALFLHSK